MPPPRRQTPAGTGRRPKVAGRTSVSPAATPATELETPATDAAKTTPTVDVGKKSVDETDTPAPVVEDGPHSRSRKRTTIVVAAIAVVLAIVAVVAALKPGTADVTDQAWIDDAATNEVSAAAGAALQTVFSYKADTIDADQDAARAVLDEDRRAEYDSSADQTKQGVLTTKTTSTAVVTDIGVSSLQGDKAEIVASMDISANQDGVDQGTVQTPVVVTLTKVDGKWLLSQIDNR